MRGIFRTRGYAPVRDRRLKGDSPCGRDVIPSPSGLPEASNEIESSGGFVNAPNGTSKRLRNSLRMPLASAEFHNSYVLPNEEEPHQAYGPRKRLPLK